MHVYAIEANGQTKIGRSMNPEQRVRGIVTQGGFSAVQQWISGPLSDAAFVESKAHKLLADRRLVGEWFSCALHEAVEAITNAAASEPSPKENKALGCLDPDSFAARLNQALDAVDFAEKNKGRSVQLGAEIGVTYRAASFWLTGEKLPSLKNAVRIARFTGVCVEWLLTGRGPEKPDSSIAADQA